MKSGIRSVGLNAYNATVHVSSIACRGVRISRAAIHNATTYSLSQRAHNSRRFSMALDPIAGLSRCHVSDARNALWSPSVQTVMDYGSRPVWRGLDPRTRIAALPRGAS